MERDLWTLERALRSHLPPKVTLLFWQGMTGEFIRSFSLLPTYNDLIRVFLPGLATFGLTTEFIALPEVPNDLFLLLQSSLAAGFSVPVFAFSAPLPSPPEYPEEMPEEENTVKALDDPTIIRQAVVTQCDAQNSLITVQMKENTGADEGNPYEPEEFRHHFSYALLSRKVKTKGSQRENIRALLLRWIAFADAFPERVLTAEETDDALRTVASDFLKTLAGGQHTPLANRLRYAANAFLDREITRGMDFLRDAVLREMSLPTECHRALLAPLDQPLSDAELRELIYLARAGTPDLKVLAACRLCYENNPDVSRTLMALRYDPDLWVRSAASK